MLYVATKSARGMRLLVAIEGFYVVTELARPGVFYRDRMFLGCDRVGNGGEILCRNIIFYVATKRCQG